MNRTNTPSSTQPRTNSTCRYLGHDWQTTAAANYRACQRDNCLATQRLQHGSWVDAIPERTNADPMTACQKQHAMPQQSRLF